MGESDRKDERAASMQLTSPAQQKFRNVSESLLRRVVFVDYSSDNLNAAAGIYFLGGGTGASRRV